MNTLKTPRTIRAAICLALLCILPLPAFAEDEAPEIPWENLKFIETGENEDFGDPPYRGHAVGAGQLVGINPEDGSIITNAVHLLPLMARSLYAADVVDAGYFVGDGSGIDNLDAGSILGRISAATLPVAGVWDASGMTIRDPRLSGDVRVDGEALTIATNLTVRGAIRGDGSELDGVAAGGGDGAVQYNRSGQLEGNTNYFIHARSGKLAARSENGNLLRVYRSGVVEDGNLTFVLRETGNTVELVMKKDGEETLRLRGDGTIRASGGLDVGSLSVGAAGGGDTWFIPESGDLSMGAFTDGDPGS